MPTFKDQLTHYMERKEAQVELDSVLKQTLHAQLVSQPIKRHAWWKLGLPIVAIGVLGGIIFTIKQNESNPTTVTTIIANSLRPQEALAAVMENTINLDSFTETFGLPKQATPLHRTMWYTSQSEPGTELSTQQIDLWKDEHNLRMERKAEASNQLPESYEATLINTATQQLCGNYTLNGSPCTDLDLIQQQALEQTLSNHGAFYPVDTETFVADLAVEPFFSPANGQGVYLTWSTTEPIVKGEVSYTSGSLGNYTGHSIANFSKQPEHWHTNEQRNDRYWHSLPLDYDVMNTTGDLFVQILEVNNTHMWDGDPTQTEKQSLRKGSMVYRVNYNDRSVNALNADQFSQIITERSLMEVVVEGIYAQALQPAIYVMRHAQELGEPIQINSATKREQSVVALRYQLPETYLAEVSTLYSGPHDVTIPTFIDLYMDANQTEFLGYTISRQDQTLEELWITDETISEDQLEELFSVEAWLAALGN